MTRKRRPRRAPASVAAEMAPKEEVAVDVLDDSNGSSEIEPDAELMEVPSEALGEDTAAVVESQEVVAEVSPEALPAEAIEQLLVDEVAPEMPADDQLEAVMAPILVEAEDLALAEVVEEPWLELDQVPLPPRGAPVEEEESSEPVDVVGEEVAPVLAAAQIQREPRGFFGWLVGAVILGAAIGAIAALLVLSGINDGLSYVSAVRGVTLVEEQNRLAAEVALLTQDLGDVQAQLTSLSELASEVGILSGDAVITDDQEIQLLDGLWYINIHTAMNPSGEIRGQLGAEYIIPEPVTFTVLGLGTAVLLRRRRPL